MNYCKTCMYWSRVKADSWMGEIEAAGGNCGSPKTRQGCAVGYDLDALVYDYDEGGKFWTGPEFGCVNWSKKP